MRIENTDIFSRSVVGCVRKANEDNCDFQFQTPNGDLFVVCDGMGGHVGGATASRIAVDAICKYLKQESYPDIRQALADALECANIQILATAAEKPELTGMGTTACVLLIKDDQAWIAHCGDSRIYMYCAAEKYLHRITKDHSFVQGLVDNDLITEEMAEHHPNKNRITRALGIQPDCKPEVCPHPILPATGDVFMICSDGLSGMLDDNKLQTILQLDCPIQEKGAMMIEFAEQAGGTDNITVQLVSIADSPHNTSVFISKNPKGRRLMDTFIPADPKPSSGIRGMHLRLLGIGTAAVMTLAVLVVVGWFVVSLLSGKGCTKDELARRVCVLSDTIPSDSIHSAFVYFCDYVSPLIQKNKEWESDDNLKSKIAASCALINKKAKECYEDLKSAKKNLNDSTEVESTKESILKMFPGLRDRKIDKDWLKDVETLKTEIKKK